MLCRLTKTGQWLILVPHMTHWNASAAWTDLTWAPEIQWVVWPSASCRFASMQLAKLISKLCGQAPPHPRQASKGKQMASILLSGVCAFDYLVVSTLVQPLSVCCVEYLQLAFKIICIEVLLLGLHAAMYIHAT